MRRTELKFHLAPTERNISPSNRADRVINRPTIANERVEIRRIKRIDANSYFDRKKYFIYPFLNYVHLRLTDFRLSQILGSVFESTDTRQISVDSNER